MALNKRCIGILIQLASSDQPMAIVDLKKSYKVSERTIRYDLKEIEDWLKHNNLGSIKTIYAKGITLSCDQQQKAKILNQLQINEPSYDYYSSEERQKIIIIELLNSDEPIKTEYLQMRLIVSRGTIIKELKIVEQWLNKYKLVLLKKPNYGIKIQGTETSKRNALIGMAKDFMSTEQILGIIRTIDLNKKSPVNNQKYLYNDILMSNINLELLEESLFKLQDLLGVKLGGNSFASLFTHLAIALQRIQIGKNIFFPPEDLVLMEKTKEYKICEVFAEILNENFHVSIPKPEIGYITLHILAAQLHKKSEENKTPLNATLSPITNHLNATELLLKDDNINFMEMAADITKYVKTQLNIEFQNENQMMLDLCIHLKPAVHRCNYKMFLANPILDDIKQNYFRLFLIVKEALLLLNFKYPIEMNDHEVSYITLHFAAEIEKGNVLFAKRLNVLLVCASGIGTAKMLHNRIITNFNNFNIIDSISYLDFFNQINKPIDLVISTIPLKQNNYDCIVVNPLLMKEDIQKIEAFIFNHHDPSPQPKSIELQLSKTQPIQVSLDQLLIPEHIQLNVEAPNWEDALKSGANILLKRGFITSEYTDALIENIHKLGPYIVIAPGIAFSHASYKVGVKRLGMSLIRLSQSVEFGHDEHDPVKIIFTLAPSDKTSHYSALTSLMQLLLNPRDLNILFNSQNVDDILKIISKT
ncbi:MAG: hypothetical protein CVU95_14910 [Firmicutes bacterium HGW-Firmicutes-2]|jgi:transcriptional antiterminator|nr:MAG: hypothetical protein CVU95_14910 [Firmicutes bacterium HGW-Firmicutes-2]